MEKDGRCEEGNCKHTKFERQKGSYTCVSSEKLVFCCIRVIAMGNEHVVNCSIRAPRCKTTKAKVYEEKKQK